MVISAWQNQFLCEAVVLGAATRRKIAGFDWVRALRFLT